MIDIIFSPKDEAWGPEDGNKLNFKKEVHINDSVRVLSEKRDKMNTNRLKYMQQTEQLLRQARGT